MIPPELSPDALSFWREVYVAAVANGRSDPKEVAGTAVDHLIERLDVTRAAERLSGLHGDLARVTQFLPDRKILAIKELRNMLVGLGLKDAKLAVEQFMSNRTWPTYIHDAMRHRSYVSAT